MKVPVMLAKPQRSVLSPLGRVTADLLTVSGSSRRLLPLNAVSLTTPALSRVFSLLYYQIRPHFSVGARTSPFSAAAVSLCHPNLLIGAGCAPRLTTPSERR